MSTIAEAMAGGLAEVLDAKIETKAATCPKHGEYSAVVVEMPAGAPAAAGHGSCPRCVLEENHERAKREQVARAETDRRARAEQKRAEMEQRMARSLIPERFREYTLDGFPTPVGMTAEQVDSHRVVLAACRSYVNTWLQQRRSGSGMIFIGPNGRGKSGLACSIANAVMRDYHSTALFLTARGVVRHLCDTWGRKGRTEQEALDDLVGADLLIVDDVGAQIGTELEMAMLFETINARYAERRPTFIVANLPVGDYEQAGAKKPGLKTFLGARIWSRLTDDGSQILRCTWTEQRSRANEP